MPSIRAFGTIWHLHKASAQTHNWISCLGNFRFYSLQHLQTQCVEQDSVGLFLDSVTVPHVKGACLKESCLFPFIRNLSRIALASACIKTAPLGHFSTGCYQFYNPDFVSPGVVDVQDTLSPPSLAMSTFSSSAAIKVSTREQSLYDRTAESARSPHEDPR